jgi:SAM-dependent methyltransferase
MIGLVGSRRNSVSQEPKEVLIPSVLEVQMGTSIPEELDIEGLRAAFLEYTRDAYLSIPPISQPRILDAGCGTGLPTLELARLSDGEITAVDPDEGAIETLRLRIEEQGLSDRVRTVCCSIFETGLASASFDIVWEEGVFHLVDADRVLEESARLLKAGGYLVMFETNDWLEATRGRFIRHGFEHFRHVPLPSGCWWTRYYAPLEERIATIRARYDGSEELAVLGRYEAEIEAAKADATKFDCSFLLMLYLD